jgi:hypothetical protein
MAKTTVYGSYEVRTGFGPGEAGPLELETTSLSEATERLHALWTAGSCVQLFGIRNHDGSHDGECVLLRSLVAYRQAA